MAMVWGTAVEQVAKVHSHGSKEGGGLARAAGSDANSGVWGSGLSGAGAGKAGGNSECPWGGGRAGHCLSKRLFAVSACGGSRSGAGLRTLSGGSLYLPRP
jgi:hypothetical protein